MKKYKVEFTVTRKYVIDVLAEDEKTAEELADNEMNYLEENGTLHYNETDFESDSVVYDVTNTGDPFDPIN